MARHLDTRPTETGIRGDRGIARSTGQALAAAIACLLIASLVVERSVAAVQPQGTGSTSAFVTGTLDITDDDGGRSLVNLAGMVPGSVESSCITISYGGTVLPVGLHLSADVAGELASLVAVTVEAGSGAAFGSCLGFESEEAVFDGTLAELGAAETFLGELVQTGERRSFRFSFDLADTADAIGAEASADLVWEVRPS